MINIAEKNYYFSKENAGILAKRDVLKLAILLIIMFIFLFVLFATANLPVPIFLSLMCLFVLLYSLAIYGRFYMVKSILSQAYITINRDGIIFRVKAQNLSTFLNFSVTRNDQTWSQAIPWDNIGSINYKDKYISVKKEQYLSLFSKSGNIKIPFGLENFNEIDQLFHTEFQSKIVKL